MIAHSEDIIITDALTTFRELVAKQDYDQAFRTWQKMQGQIDGFSYWYNLGSLEALRKNYPEARYALETARQHTVYSRAVEQQLETVTTALEVDPVTSDGLSHHLLNFGLDLGISKLGFIAVIVLIGGILFAVKMSSRIRQVLVLCLGLLPALVVLWLQSSTVLFINFKPIPLFEGPTAALPIGKELVPGSRIIGWKFDAWVKVYESSGSFVWLPTKELKDR
ncbi:MAG: hypothetical protein ACLGG7_13705, partial [Bacteriovoracia bacterium]